MMLVICRGTFRLGRIYDNLDLKFRYGKGLCIVHLKYGLVLGDGSNKI